jgi:poly-gamma-glutamate capsule biosynthesis protein CapA/YwtB (metallophosphatase superfamily)
MRWIIGVILIFCTLTLLYIATWYHKPEQSIPTLPSQHKILAGDHSWVATLSANRLRTIIATGDVIPARSVNYQTIKHNDFTWAYTKTAEVLKSADLTIVNLESPLIPNCPITNEGMIFCGDERHVEGLVFAGVDVASIANNHMENYGIEGIRNTTNLLEQSGISVSGGENQPVIRDIKGIKFAFLAYNDIGSAEEGIAWADEELIKKQIQLAQIQADVVIVSFHWGVEYTNRPSERQTYLAHFAVDSGADLIIGNHPHWIQSTELYKGKFITYAHGNFIFDQEWSEETKRGVIGKYTFYDKTLIDATFIPIRIVEYGQPYLLDEKDSKGMMNMLKSQ